MLAQIIDLLNARNLIQVKCFIVQGLEDDGLFPIQGDGRVGQAILDACRGGVHRVGVGTGGRSDGSLVRYCFNVIMARFLGQSIAVR